MLSGLSKKYLSFVAASVVATVAITWGWNYGLDYYERWKTPTRVLAVCEKCRKEECRKEECRE